MENQKTMLGEMEYDVLVKKGKYVGVVVNNAGNERVYIMSLGEQSPILAPIIIEHWDNNVDCSTRPATAEEISDQLRRQLNADNAAEIWRLDKTIDNRNSVGVDGAEPYYMQVHQI